MTKESMTSIPFDSFLPLRFLFFSQLLLSYYLFWLLWVFVVACGLSSWGAWAELQHVGSWFPHRGSNLGPLLWERGVLSSRPPGKSPLYSPREAATMLVLFKGKSF